MTVFLAGTERRNHTCIFALLQNDHVGIIHHFALHYFGVRVLRTIVAVRHWVLFPRTSFARVNFTCCPWRLTAFLVCFVYWNWVVCRRLGGWWLVACSFREGWTLILSCFYLNNNKLRWNRSYPLWKYQWGSLLGLGIINFPSALISITITPVDLTLRITYLFFH